MIVGGRAPAEAGLLWGTDFLNEEQALRCTDNGSISLEKKIREMGRSMVLFYIKKFVFGFCPGFLAQGS